MLEKLASKLEGSKSYITLETTPPHAARFMPVIERIEQLGLEQLVDGFTTTDSPLAKMRYSSLFAATLLQQRFAKPAIATLSMRDRNKIALQSDLLGANEAGVRAILALTGDPASISDQPSSKAVLEGDSSLLLDIIECFNSGIDYAGRPLSTPPQPILAFAVIPSHAKQPKRLLKRLRKKIDHGARGIISQPVYDIASAKQLLDLASEANATKQSQAKGATLIFGIFPIVRLRTAQFLASHVPGIDVPKRWMEELKIAARDGEQKEYEVGLELSQALFCELKALHPKLHIMTANNFSLAAKLLSEV